MYVNHCVKSVRIWSYSGPHFTTWNKELTPGITINLFGKRYKSYENQYVRNMSINVRITFLKCNKYLMRKRNFEILVIVHVVYTKATYHTQASYDLFPKCMKQGLKRS